ncbi:MAG TPA: transposase [Gammaproteobacteria bacterium]|nr:transposase [Gammaproteobacteria bacterium]
MPRQPRYRIPGFPQHVVQRGNDRQATFYADNDFAIYRHYLAEAAAKHHCEVHAYCLMSNHVHLLVTPRSPDAVCKLIQSVGRRYVYYINHAYERTGTLWEGRYRATLVEDDAYALTCYRYIELNPVRAALVDHPAGYPHSSYRRNALGDVDFVVSEHAVYTALANTRSARMVAYRRLFEDQLEKSQLAEIRQMTQSCRVLGSDSFRDRIEHVLRRSVRPGQPGRPRNRRP